MTQDLIYVNNAASSWPKPPEVIDAVREVLVSPVLEQGRTSLRVQADYPDETRKRLASFFHTPSPEEYVFTANATDSLNLLISGFAEEETQPFHVITSSLEHNSVIRPLWRLKRKGRISLTVIPPGEDGRIAPGAVKEAIGPDTRLAVFSHAGNVTGTVQDIRTICQICSENTLFSIIDGSQSAGQLPIDLSQVPCDAFVFTGHKYLFGIPGTGGFFLRTPDRIEPVRVGGTGSDSGSPCPPGEMPGRFEAGTPNFPGIAALNAGIQFVQERDPGHIFTQTQEMAEIILSRLREIERVHLLQEKLDLPVIAFTVSGMDADDIGLVLSRKYGIVTRTGLHCAPWVHEALTGGEGSVRISLSCMNTRDECLQVADACAEIL